MDGDVDATDKTLAQGAPIGGTTLGWKALTAFNSRLGFGGYGRGLSGLSILARRRTYNEDEGRWLQRDALRYRDSESLYEYVRSNPTLAIDPMGLATTQRCPPCKSKGVVQISPSLSAWPVPATSQTWTFNTSSCSGTISAPCRPSNDGECERKNGKCVPKGKPSDKYDAKAFGCKAYCSIAFTSTCGGSWEWWEGLNATGPTWDQDHQPLIDALNSGSADNILMYQTCDLSWTDTGHLTLGNGVKFYVRVTVRCGPCKTPDPPPE